MRKALLQRLVTAAAAGRARAVHRRAARPARVHPAARVTGFGYDTMFGGLGCSLLTHDIFPQCWSRGVPLGGGQRGW